MEAGRRSKGSSHVQQTQWGGLIKRLPWEKWGTGCAPAKKPIDLAWQRGTDGVFAGELI